MKLQNQTRKKLGVSKSAIVGWGLFALEHIVKDELIGEYIGEMIDNAELNKRDKYMDLENSTYMFTLNDEYTIDSRSMGNILRYANHSKFLKNAYSKIMFVNGLHRICLFALTDIKKHDEIFFDYDGQNTLSKIYTWINDTHRNKNYQNKSNKASTFLQKKRQRSHSSHLNENNFNINKVTKKNTNNSDLMSKSYYNLLQYYKECMDKTEKELINYAINQKLCVKHNAQNYIDDFIRQSNIYF